MSDIEFSPDNPYKDMSDEEFLKHLDFNAIDEIESIEIPPNSTIHLHTYHWISTEERLPDNLSRVLVYFKSKYENKDRITCAEYVAPHAVLAEDFLDPEWSEDFEEYDEENDCYWTPTGFYESQYQTDVNLFIDQKVLYWMSLPQNPENLS